MQESPNTQSFCVAAATRVLGDKWTPRLISILYSGPIHFCALQSESGINPRTLSSRLSKLEDMGIVLKSFPVNDASKPIYSLTSKGNDLFPILERMVEWGRHHGNIVKYRSK